MKKSKIKNLKSSYHLKLNKWSINLGTKQNKWLKYKIRLNNLKECLKLTIQEVFIRVIFMKIKEKELEEK